MPNKIDERPRIFLDKVHLKGYKSIEDLTIDFQKGLNILIGKNGAGKSNFLDSLFQSFLSNKNYNLPFNYVLLEFVSNDNHFFILELKNEHPHKIDREIFLNGTNLLEKLTIDGEVFHDNSKEFEKKRIKFKGQSIFNVGNLNINSLLKGLGYQNIFPLFIKYQIPKKIAYVETPGLVKINKQNPFNITEFSESFDFIYDIFLRFDNTQYETLKNLSHVLELLKIPGNIKDNVNSYSPIEDLRFSSTVILYEDEKSITIDNIRIEFKINGNWLPWSQLSDGTQRLFYIIAEVTNTKGLVLIEEPELGIHPHQFSLLMDFLKEQSEDKQIIISTHSPKALDHLSPDELNNILITYYDLKRGTQIRHLSTGEVKKAKKYMKEVGFFSDYWLLSDLEE